MVHAQAARVLGSACSVPPCMAWTVHLCRWLPAEEPAQFLRSAMYPCWGTRACHRLKACSLLPSAAALHGLAVTRSCMHGLSMAAGHGDISTLDLSCLPAAGAHNMANAATAALLAASLGVGVSPASLQRTIPLLKEPPHRCALLRVRCRACPSAEATGWRALEGNAGVLSCRGTAGHHGSTGLLCITASQQVMCPLATNDQVLDDCALPPLQVAVPGATRGRPLCGRLCKLHRGVHHCW